MPVVLRYPPSAPVRPPAQRLEAADGETFLIVVPTKRRIRHLMRELVCRMPGRIAPGLHLHTLETLATGLFGALRPGNAPASGVYRALLYRLAVKQAGPDFRYFALRAGTFPLHRGTFETITDVITRLKETGVTPEMLEEELQIAEPDELQKLADVIGIYRAYEHILESAGKTDTGGILRAMALECTREQFTRVFRSLFPAVDLLVIAGFDEFSEPEMGLLRKLQALPGVTIDLTFDFHPGNPALFGHLEENYARFRSLGLAEPPQSHRGAWLDLLSGGREGGADAGSTAAMLAQRLFGGSGQPLALADRVTLIRARNRTEEVRAVCRLIKRMARERPELDLSRVCVAMHVPGKYTDIFRRAFAQYGIPANITDRFQLARAPLVVAVLGLLQVAMRGFLREDILRIIHAPCFSLATDPRLGGHALGEVSGKLRITGGYRTWLDRIDRALASPGDPTGGAEETVLLNTARADIQRLSAVLRPFEQNLTPAGFRRETLTLLERLEVLRNAVTAPAPGGPEDREREIRALARFIEVLEETSSALAATEGADVQRPLAFHLEALTAAVAAERFNVREQFGRGVLVTAIEETRGLPMDVMFLVGMVDGEFPSVYQPEVFYSLARQGRRARRHAWEQRYLFYQAITNWSDHLYLTCPEQEGELELVPSTFLDAFLDATEATRTDAQTLMDPDDILSEGELYRSVALSQERMDDSSATDEARSTMGAVTRGVAVERSRLRTHTLPAFEGIIGADVRGDAAPALEALRHRVFSVSQLESYGNCPFQFFGTRVLRLRPAGDMREDLSPLERGSLLHEILHTFMAGRRRRGLPDLWRCSDAEAEEAERELLQLAGAALDRLDLPDPFWETERESLLGGGKRPGLLRLYLRAERKRTTPMESRFFETSFGLRTREATSSESPLSESGAVQVGAVRLRGRVDRIEIGEDVFAIIDYKTGRTSAGLQEIREGTSLQLPLYLHAVEYLLCERLGISAVPGAGLHYSFGRDVVLRPVLASDERRGVAFEADSRSRQVVPADRDLRALINGSITRAGEYAAAMAEGRFPLTRPERVAKLCRSCPLNTICRIQASHHLEAAKDDET